MHTGSHEGTEGKCSMHAPGTCTHACQDSSQAPGCLAMSGAPISSDSDMCTPRLEPLGCARQQMGLVAR